MSAIDIHTHFVPKGWPDLHTQVGPGVWPRMQVESEREAMIMIGSKEFRRVQSNCWDAAERLADMDEDGVDLQVISATPVFFSYDRAGSEAAKVARIFNELALEICEPARDRLIPFAQVPLQDADAACRELDRAIDDGHVGVEIGNHVGDRDLDDAGIVTFLQHCADRDVPVFVHPWDMHSSPRLDRWMAQWLAGMPAETHLSIISMILGGVFDRVSPSLRIAFAHGGGSFAFWLGRFENAWHRRHDLLGMSELPPSAYTNRISVDSVVFDPHALRMLIDTLGIEQVMLGSDYPYPLGERPVGKVVDDAFFLTDAEKDAVRFGNAERFLGARAGLSAGAPLRSTPLASERIPH